MPEVGISAFIILQINYKRERAYRVDIGILPRKKVSRAHDFISRHSKLLIDSYGTIVANHSAMQQPR